MEKEFIGKLYLKNIYELFIVCGYDYISESYILYKIRDDSFWRYSDSYMNLKENKKDKLIDRNGLLEKFKELEKKAFKLEEELNLYERYYDKYGNLYEFNNIFHRYKETRKNIDNLIYIIDIFEKHPERYFDDLCFYKKELKKHKKGLRRINKRFYSYFKEDTDYIINLIEGDSLFDIRHIVYKKEKSLKDLKLLDEHLNNLDDYLEKHGKEGTV